MKKALSLLLVLALLMTVALSVHAEPETTLKGVRFQTVSNGSKILSLALSAIKDDLLAGDDVVVTVYNNLDAAYPVYVRTDESYYNPILTAEVSIAPRAAQEFHCGKTSKTNQILLMSTDQTTKCDLTICNLTQAQAEAVKAKFSVAAEIVDNPVVKTLTLKGVRFQTVSNGSKILTLALSAIKDDLLAGDDVVVTVYNNLDAAYPVYVRTDESYYNPILTTEVSIKPGAAQEFHCGKTSKTNQILLMSTDQTTKCDLTICNLTQAQAEAVKAKFSVTAEIVDNPEIKQEEDTTLKGVRFQATANSSKILTMALNSLSADLLTGDEVVVSIYNNNASAAYPLYLRTDENWVGIKQSATVEIQPGTIEEFRCGYTAKTTNILLMSTNTTSACDLTICNLTAEQASKLQAKFGSIAQIVENPEIKVLKGVRFQAVANGSKILTLALSAIKDDLLAGDDVAVTVLNNLNATYPVYLRTDESYYNPILSETIKLPAGAAVELRCGKTSKTNQIMLMSTDQTNKCDLTICNLTEEQAAAVKAKFSVAAEIVDNPDVKPISFDKRPEEVLDHEDGSLLLSDRNHRCAGPSQNLTKKLAELGAGEYFYAGWFRFIDPADDVATRGVKVNLGLETKDTGTKWPQTSQIVVKDGEWHYIEQIITINFTEPLNNAYTFIQTVYADGDGSDAYAYKGDMEWDGFMLCKYTSNDYGTSFSENLFENGACDCDYFGKNTGWGTNQKVTIVNSQATDHDYTCVENADGSVKYTKGFVPMTDKNINYMGRWIDVNTKRQASFESNLSLKFTGNTIYVNGSGAVWYDIDYGTPKLITLNGVTELGKDLGSGEHLLRLYTKMQQSRPTIIDFVVDQNASTLPQTPELNIEFIGDSIMEGYCNAADADPVLGSNSTMTSYGTKVGMRLNKEYGYNFNVVAFGGSGILNRSTDSLIMPERYFKEREMLTGDNSQTVIGDWNTANYVPDVIVINLGTNDGNGSADTFKTNYKNFIADLQKAYPGVTIVLMTPFNGTRAADVRTIVTELNDEDVVLVDSALWKIPAGADNLHPAAATHETIANDLYTALQCILFGHDDEGEAVDNGDGTHSTTCSICGEVAETSEAHTFVNGICSVCGAVEPADPQGTGDITALITASFVLVLAGAALILFKKKA